MLRLARHFTASARQPARAGDMHPAQIRLSARLAGRRRANRAATGRGAAGGNNSKRCVIGYHSVAAPRPRTKKRGLSRAAFLWFAGDAAAQSAFVCGVCAGGLEDVGLDFDRVAGAQGGQEGFHFLRDRDCQRF